MLDPFSDIISTQKYPYYHHTNAATLKRHFDSQGWDWNDYFVFISIRNPWEMLVSLYFYGLPDEDGKYFWERHREQIKEDIYLPHHRIVPNNIVTFEEWISNFKLERFTLNHFAYSKKGEPLVDHIIKLETLKDSIIDISREIGINFDDQSIPYKNVTTHPDYRDMYSRKTMDIVGDVFESDIEAGGYRFNGTPKVGKAVLETRRSVLDNPLFQSERSYLLNHLESKKKREEEERKNKKTLQAAVDNYQTKLNQVFEKTAELRGQLNTLKIEKDMIANQLSNYRKESSRFAYQLEIERKKRKKELIEKRQLENQIENLEQEIKSAKAKNKQLVAQQLKAEASIMEKAKEQEKLNEVLRSLLEEERLRVGLGNAVKRFLKILYPSKKPKKNSENASVEKGEKKEPEKKTNIKNHQINMEAEAINRDTINTIPQNVLCADLKTVITGIEWDDIAEGMAGIVRKLGFVFLPELDLDLCMGNELPETGWVGVAHVPNRFPRWLSETGIYQPFAKELNKNLHEQSFKEYCRMVFVFSEDHAQVWKDIDIPVTVLSRPLPNVSDYWSWDTFNSNPEKKLVQSGWWLMRMHALHILPETGYKKIWVRHPDYLMEEALNIEREYLTKKNVFFGNMGQSVSAYDNLDLQKLSGYLCENIAFAHYHAASAPDFLLQCIAHHTPILINALPAVREYLGDDYPLYYYFYADAVKKAGDLDLLRQANDYLAKLSIKLRRQSVNLAQQIRDAL
jgi:hypothetical protein